MEKKSNILAEELQIRPYIIFLKKTISDKVDPEYQRLKYIS